MKKNWTVFVIILLVAAGLRLVFLDAIPPGLEHDEVANWLIDREILAGNHSIYFTQAYGHEAGYHYLQAAVIGLVGDHALSLRLPSVFAGLLVIAISYILTKQLVGERAALVSAALLAVLFWPVFFSRLGIRAMLLPVFSGFAAYFFWRGIELETNSNRHHKAVKIPGKLWIGLAGAMAGLSLYTYMAARAVPIIFVLFSFYLLLVHRRQFKLDRLAIFFLVMLVSCLPLIIWLYTHPGAEFRITEINRPLTALISGNIKPILRNGIKLLGFFGWQGDPLIRQNIPGRPVFDPIGAILFYSGLAIAIWRWRRPQYAFALLWLAGSLTPSLVTADAPSSIRCINCLPVLGLFVGLTLAELAKLERKKVVYWIAPLWLLLVSGWTIRDYFIRWPQDAEVQFVWQTAFQQAADYLDTEYGSGSVVVAGWTPETMDPPSMDLLTKNAEIPFRYVDPKQTLILPADGGLVVDPVLLPFDQLLFDELTGIGAEIEEYNQFIVYRINPPVVRLPTQEAVYVEEELEYVGNKLLTDSSGLTALTYWLTGGPIEGPLRIFFHVMDPEGTTIGQDDALGSNTAFWKDGDLIIQVHRVRLTTGEYNIVTGLYDPESGERKQYSTHGGIEDTIFIGKVTIP
ncbi:MAG: glycosyltransferase family 39 protein [Anaerolineales bacterium]|nr:glycosyltransferase family 39 protein [Anaerolineales bacterium]